jgi:hypothetical protein
VTKELIKLEVDKVREEYLGLLYRVVKALEEPSLRDGEESWQQFIAATYGSLESQSP